MSELTITHDPESHYATAVLDVIGDIEVGQQVLEIGCGTGVLSERLVRLGHIVTIVDHRKPLLDVARRRIGFAVDAHLGHPADALNFARDGDFDLVVVGTAVHAARDWLAALPEIVRVLRVGGRLVVAMPPPGEGNVLDHHIDHPPTPFHIIDAHLPV